MSSSFRSIADIFSDVPDVASSLQNAENYLAHRSKYTELNPEKLHAHIHLVKEYAIRVCNYYGLDKVIDRSISDFLSKQFPDQDNHSDIGNFIKTLFTGTIVFHDFGKANTNFQSAPNKMNNPGFKYIPNYILDTRHSSLSAYLFITYYFQDFYDKFDKSQHLTLSILVLTFSYPILKHHSRNLSDKISEDISFASKEVNEMKEYITKFGMKTSPLFSETIPIKSKLILEKISSLETNFSLYALLKLNYSLLTASDYLATNEYCNGMKLSSETDFGLIGNELKNKLIHNVQTKKVYNQEAFQAYSENYKYQNPRIANNENLNVLRKEMSIKVINSIRKNTDSNLFYIEAPTGGGKTNLSMIAAIELLKANNELNNVFYVFPFTTLITQTHKSLCETLGLDLDEVAQIHSKTGFDSSLSKEDQADGLYSDDHRNFIDRLFVNFPITLMTHIKFFDVLKSNEKETNYLLHRLANSVVIIDEIQSYNPEHWDKMIYFISNYARLFNIRFILMSATLPKLGNLKIFKDYNDEFVYLLGNDVKELYFQNPNFIDRVKIKFDFIDKQMQLSHSEKLEFLGDILFEKSKEYAKIENGKHKPLGSVFTIIEFIFKKSASEFYQIIEEINNRDHFFDTVFVLSGTILEHRRRHIINYLKNKNNRSKRVLLITTQVVEAGVDIDMDLGFKDVSLIDSDEQLAGRINRNVNKPQCELYLFKLDKAGIIYGKDDRFQFTREKLDTNIYQEILQTKNFDKLYNEIFLKIDKLNQSLMIQNFSSYEREIKFLNFSDINKQFKLIDQENLSVFVPIDVPVEVESDVSGQNDPIFSENELQFLQDYGVIPENMKIKGSEVFDVYVNLIENKQSDFIKHKVNHARLQGIMSKFVFSVFKGKDTERKFIEFSDIEKNKFGYIYLNGWNRSADNPLYNECFGINDQAFNESVFI